MSKSPEFESLFFSKCKDFLDIYLTNQIQRSKDTVKAYRISLASFYSFVTEKAKIRPTNFCFSDCTYSLVLSYSQYLQKQGASNNTVNQKLAALKAYLKYVADDNFALMQVYLSIQKVPLLRVPKLQRPILEKEELKALFAAPKNTKIGRRDRVILILLYDLAVRVSELTRITLGDISLGTSNPSIIIHGKGKKTRSVVMNEKCVEHIKDYISFFHGENYLPEYPLFYTIIHGKMNPMSSRNVERIVKKYCDIIREDFPSLPETIYPHMLRRSRATGLYRDGVPLELVSAILGHSSTETTKIYAIPSVDQLRDAISKGLAEDDNIEKLWEGKDNELRKFFGLG